MREAEKVINQPQMWFNADNDYPKYDHEYYDKVEVIEVIMIIGEEKK